MKIIHSVVAASQKFDDPVHPSCKLLLPEGSEKTECEGRWDIPYPAFAVRVLATKMAPTIVDFYRKRRRSLSSSNESPCGAMYYAWHYNIYKNSNRLRSFCIAFD